MTNAQAAAFFASLPPDKPAMVLVINGMNNTAASLVLDEPGTNLEEVEDPSQLDEGDENLLTALFE